MSLLSYGEALQRILGKVDPLATEEVELIHSFGRALGADISAQADIPPFKRSMMDGYAIRSSDVLSASSTWPVELPVSGELHAGGVVPSHVMAGSALRIMMGAPIPEGADAVIPQEHVESINGSGKIRIKTPLHPQANIAPQGEDVKAGEVVFKKGAIIRAAELGMLAQLGCAEVEVFQRPRVAILGTGDELVSVSETPTGSQIRDSNSYSSWGQTMAIGAHPYLLGIVGDNEDMLTQKIREGLEGMDVLVIAGGMSVGERDLVKEILVKSGVQTDFWRVSVKPGKPFLYGHRGSTHVFGLPGNPVSAMVTFEIFAKPALRKMMGEQEVETKRVKAKLTKAIKRKPGRMEFMRTRLAWVEDHYEVTPTGPQGSGILKSMVLANSLTIIPEEVSEVPAGTFLDVLML